MALALAEDPDHALDSARGVSTRAAVDAVALAVAQLTSAVTSLVGLVASTAPRGSTGHPMCDPDALAGLRALEQAETALQATRVRLLVAAAGAEPERLTGRMSQPSGADSRVSDVRAVEIGAVLRCTPNRARNLVHEARVLSNQIPGVLHSLAQGQVSGYQSALAAAAWRDLVHRHEAAGSQVTPALAERFQSRILRRAAQQTVADFKRTLATAVAALSPAPSAVQPDPRADRQVSVSPAADGMAWLTAYLDVVSANRVMNVLEHTARHDHTLRGTLPQRMADALVAIVDGRSDISAPARAQAAEVQVLVSLESMLATAAAFTDGITPDTALFGEVVGSGHIIEGRALLDLLADARFRRLIVCPRTGQLVDFGRSTYRPPRPLRDQARGRDRSCRAPGCTRPARLCDLDHVQPWQDGGATDSGNVAVLCRTHHVLKTHGGWQYALSADGVTRWRTPSGADLIKAAGEYLDHVAADPDPPPQ